MKSIKSTLFALSAFLLLNSPAFASDSAYIFQNGYGDSATTNQVAHEGADNWLNILQDYSSQYETAGVTQNGSGALEASIYQNGLAIFSWTV